MNQQTVLWVSALTVNDRQTEYTVMFRGSGLQQESFLIAFKQAKMSVGQIMLCYYLHFVMAAGLLFNTHITTLLISQLVNTIQTVNYSDIFVSAS